MAGTTTQIDVWNYSTYNLTQFIFNGGIQNVPNGIQGTSESNNYTPINATIQTTSLNFSTNNGANTNSISIEFTSGATYTYQATFYVVLPSLSVGDVYMMSVFESPGELANVQSIFNPAASNSFDLVLVFSAAGQIVMTQPMSLAALPSATNN